MREKTKHSHDVYPNQLHLVPRIHLDLYHGQFFFLLLFCFFFFLRQGLITCLSGCHELTLYTKLTSNSRELPASASQVLDLKACTTTPSDIRDNFYMFTMSSYFNLGKLSLQMRKKLKSDSFP